MADEVNAKDDGAKFTPHPAGQFAARCVDVLNLGERVEQFQDKPPKIVRKCALVFDAGEKAPENGEPMTVSVEFTISMFERSGLRLFLESWRGRSYTDDEAEDGVPLHKLENIGALISVEHKKSGAGRMYAKLKTISPLPKAMTAPELNGYKRPEFWSKRKEEYASEVSKFRQMHAPLNHSEAPPQDGEDSDFPPF